MSCECTHSEEEMEVYLCALSTWEPAMANTLSPAAPVLDTFSKAWSAALELLVRKSSSTGVN